jgi:hypothetical protein
VWWENKEGEFSVKSAYYLLKHKKEVQQSNQSILVEIVESEDYTETHSSSVANLT